MFYSENCKKIPIKPKQEHFVAVKHILNYFWRTRDYMLVYFGEDLTPIGYTDFDSS